jgi:hypothetical protein
MRLLAAVVLLPLPLAARTYSASFKATENPISEGGAWINGAAVGLDWCNVQTGAGLVWGVGPCPTEYGDPTAILAGAWGPNQTVQATAHIVEINFGVSHAYVEIVRWNGPLANFTYLERVNGFTIRNGDVAKAAIDGNTISCVREQHPDRDRYRRHLYNRQSGRRLQLRLWLHLRQSRLDLVLRHRRTAVSGAPEPEVYPCRASFSLREASA